MIAILSELLNNITTINESIKCGEIDGSEYQLHMFAEEPELIEDLISEIQNGLQIAMDKR